MKTSERLAAEYKVGKATIERDGQFALQVDTLTELRGEAFRQALFARDLEVSGTASLPSQEAEHHR